MIANPFTQRVLWPSVRRFILALCIVGQIGRPTKAAEDPPLTNLLGAEIGLCVEVRELRSHLREATASEWFRRLSDLPMVKRWQQGPEFAKWQAGQASLAVLVGQPLDQFVEELFGESVVVAIVPSPSGPPKALLLSQAAKDGTWDRVLALWDQLEAHEVQTRSSSGRAYQLRQKKVNGQVVGPDLFTVTLGRTLALSEHEDLIRDILARAAARAERTLGPALPQTEAYQRAMSALPDGCAIRIFVEPRRWDVALQQNTSLANWLLPLWQKLDWLAAGLELREGLIAHAVVHHRTADLSSPWPEFVTASETPSDLAARLPARAILAGEFRFAPALVQWLQTLDTSEKAQRDWQTFFKVARGLLGRDLMTEVLPHARPALGGAIVPKLPVDEWSAPVDGLLVWPFDFTRSPAPADGSPTLRESLDGAALTLLNFAAVAHNSRNPDDPATLRVRRRDGLSLKWLECLPLYRPAVGISDDHLLVATDPELISHFAALTSAEDALPSESLFATVRARHFAESSQWLFLNSRAARHFLSEQHEPLSRQVAHWRRIAQPSAAAQLQRLREVLQPFDAAFVATRVSAGEVRFTLGAVTPAPRP